MTSLKIPILLLKTKSIPNDSYEEYFSSPSSLFAPVFVPVLEHKPNASNLEQVKKLLQEGELKGRYGGMIFTSQRAVEGFAQVVQELERVRNLAENEEESILVGNEHSEVGSTQTQLLPSLPPTTSTPIFPIYTVGPATSRTLRTLLSTSPTILSPLHPEILGSETGNGEALAKYILEHYRTLFQPQTQLNTSKTSQSSSNDGDAEDFNNKSHPSLPPLLFLVGEQRRDIIPKTLMSPSLSPEQRTQVEELVVYGTGVMESFPTDLDRAIRMCRNRASTGNTDTDIAIDRNTKRSDPSQSKIVIVVVFSPSGCRQLLRRLGFLDEGDKARSPPSAPTTALSLPPDPSSSAAAPPLQNLTLLKHQQSGQTGSALASSIDLSTTGRPRYIIATIGPTTYAYLQTSFNYQADLCAETPSPEGVGKGVEAFLRKEGLL
ncbi:hypothetical protein EPUS_05301 [Endocarpon pusillum Z07020]|uniref:Tetrapyrrole biosynthesis uroporphyrinogen III synthase domain-containing protein n=1 Tax=Endocarpon pusillum (strain Z07020 / HMAS-L-300199) TaxID=1263415 RepID=U1HQA2_ENDPU|nr:uncharacterized protein EPUS_05301 [Endocarpon pusillum Z07020]ERF71249.1 hypothetical protein EPUS_05301 [Endocarpon pusillum Z07020]